MTLMDIIFTYCSLLIDNGSGFNFFNFRYIKLGVTPDSIEAMYQKAHTAIRADPAPKAKADKTVTKKRWTAAKIGLEARKAKVAAAKEAFLAQIEDQKD